MTDAITRRDATASYVTLAQDTAITADGRLVAREHADAVRFIGPAGREFLLAAAVKLGIVNADGSAKPFGDPEPEPEPETIDYESMTKAELLELADSRGFEVSSRATKARLIELLAEGA